MSRKNFGSIVANDKIAQLAAKSEAEGATLGVVSVAKPTGPSTEPVTGTLSMVAEPSDVATVDTTTGVTHGATAKARSRVRAVPQGKGTKDRPYIRENGVKVRRTNVALPLDLHAAIRKRAFKLDIRQNQVIEEALRAYFDAK